MFQKLRNWNFGRKNNEKTPLVQVPAPVEPAPVEVPTQEPAPVEVPVEPVPAEPAPAPPAKSNTNPLAYDELVYRDNNNLETSKPKKESTAAYTSGIYREGYEPTKVDNKKSDGFAYVSDNNNSNGNYAFRGGKKQRKSKKRTTKKRRNSKKRRSNKKR
jgi:hypothetical protein